MSQLIIKNDENNKLQYNAYYEGKKLKKNSSFEFKKNSFLKIKQKTKFSNPAFIVFLWFVLIIKVIILAICSFFVRHVQNVNFDVFKDYQKILINVADVTKDEVNIIIGDSYIEVDGFEVKSIEVIENKYLKTYLELQNGKWLLLNKYNK